MGNLFGDRDLMSAARGGNRRRLTPLLTIVFLGSYGLMTTLIVEQGNTIQSQSNLIQVLQRDSRELWAGKAKAQTDQAVRDQSVRQSEPVQSPGPSRVDQKPDARAPMNHAPLSRGEATKGQSPSAQVPSTEAPITSSVPSPTPKQQTRSGHASKSKANMPHEPLPPVPASDLGDQRRVLNIL